MSEHTPGPWKTRETEEHWGRVNVHIEGPDDLELACAYQRTSSENKANARLIAAAPALLQAAKDFVEWFECDRIGDKPGAELHYARAAISKAMGEV